VLSSIGGVMGAVLSRGSKGSWGIMVEFDFWSYATSER
jgi:hypothetical protein